MTRRGQDAIVATSRFIPWLTLLITVGCGWPVLASAETKGLPEAAVAAEPPPVRGAQPATSPLNLRPMPASLLAPTASLQAVGTTRALGDAGRMRFEPTRNVLEWGVQGSREALIACRRGAYAGAVVASYQYWTPQSNAQPDHCDRF